ncbi:sensor histidine kinase [Vulcaniibacterium gelatinicum]|uniref:sensor histidine kinase n=1 Tax=Vulcaniibacterium gelatinicum TaxID=2598725 RepID=UPI0011C84767|nr:HAMP domain-containing sensor histidine kinase [Vulcaniibacterium gelatinicum]
MSHALPRRVRVAFLLQVFGVSLAVVLGGWAVSSVIERSYVRKASAAEAAHFFEMRAADPVHPVPNTRLVRGWFVPAGVGAEGLPAGIAALPAGYHDLSGRDALVRVERRPAGTLYLVYQRSLVNELLYGLVVLPVAIALLAVLAVSWLMYRLSQRLVAPVNWLAREVARWDPREPDIGALAPERLPADVRNGETQQLARALHSLGRRLEAFVARERNFTRDASHELRTPLTVVRVGTDLLDREPLSERGRRSLQRIQHAARDMEAVIDAFLILAREAEVEPLSEDFAVAGVVQAEVEKVRPLLADKPVELRVVAEASPVLHAPPRVLGVMLGNLLENAARFTERGEIEVRIGADRLSVRDTGPGMDAATAARAFDPFYRGGADGTGAAGRKGLGLSIVHRLGERFGWPVQLHSAPGAGTEVTIHFG